jgi:hypothetical protein
VLGVCSQAHAQSKWVAPYKKGLEAVKAEQWNVAIEELKKAVAIEPSAGPKPTGDGNYLDPYYPQFYLALAYARTKQWDLAYQYLNIAKRWAKSSPLGADEKRLQPALEEEIRATRLDPNFGVAAGKGEAALAAKQFGEAIRQFKDAQRYDDGAEFAKRRLGDRLKEAAAGYRDEISAMVVSARALLGSPGTLDEAKAALQLIEKRLAQDNEAADAVVDLPRADFAEAMKTLAQREREYQGLLAAAGQVDTAGRLQEAKAAYAKAASAYPQQAARDKVAERQRAVQARLDERQRAAQARLDLQLQVESAQRVYAAGNFDEAVKIATAVLNIDPTSQDMLVLRSRAESRIALRDGTAAVGQRRYADAEKSFAEAVAKDPEHKPAAEALRALREFGDLAVQARKLAAEKKYAEAYDALDRLQVKDQARFEAAGLGTLRQTLKQEQEGAANKDVAAAIAHVRALDEQKKWAEALQALDRLKVQDPVRAEAHGVAALRQAILEHRAEEKNSGKSAARAELAKAKQLVTDEETDAACTMLGRLRELPDELLDRNEQAEVLGYLGIAYFRRSQDKQRAAEKAKWEEQAVLAFREARARNRKWQPPGEFGIALLAFFTDRAR